VDSEMVAEGMLGNIDAIDVDDRFEECMGRGRSSQCKVGGRRAHTPTATTQLIIYRYTYTWPI
jgi:hypothetical protein